MSCTPSQKVVAMINGHLHLSFALPQLGHTDTLPSPSKWVIYRFAQWLTKGFSILVVGRGGEDYQTERKRVRDAGVVKSGYMYLWQPVRLSSLRGCFLGRPRTPTYWQAASLASWERSKYWGAHLGSPRTEYQLCTYTLCRYRPQIRAQGWDHYSVPIVLLRVEGKYVVTTVTEGPGAALGYLTL